MKTLLDFKHMRLEKKAKTAWVTFTRKASLNAMNNTAVASINRVAMALREDPDVRVAGIRGEGRAFSTGMRMSKQLINRAFDAGYEDVLRLYFELQKRAQFSMDAETSKRAYLAGEEPSWQ